MWKRRLIQAGAATLLRESGLLLTRGRTTGADAGADRSEQSSDVQRVDGYVGFVARVDSRRQFRLPFRSERETRRKQEQRLSAWGRRLPGSRLVREVHGRVVEKQH